MGADGHEESAVKIPAAQTAGLSKVRSRCYECGVSTLAEIESAVDVLPLPQQQELLHHLEVRLKRRPADRRLPLVPATGQPITQEQIDDALHGGQVFGQWSDVGSVAVTG